MSASPSSAPVSAGSARAPGLVLFQRTPAWVLPRRDRIITGQEKWVYRRVPPAQQLARLGNYLAREPAFGAFVAKPGVLKAAQRVAVRHLARSVGDPVLRAKLTPRYVMGCKRILLSSDFYRALMRPNVEVVGGGLTRLDGRTAIAGDGTVRDVDVIILATGFRAVEVPIAGRITGAGGVTLAQAWGGDMKALRGTTVPGFPNLCLVIGPNTGLGHSSMIHIIESQLRYIVDYLATLDRTGAAALDARPGAQERWCAGIERRMASSVWTTGGCMSWYLNAAGRNPTLWPGSTLRFRRATRRVGPSGVPHHHARSGRRRLDLVAFGQHRHHQILQPSGEVAFGDHEIAVVHTDLVDGVTRHRPVGRRGRRDLAEEALPAPDVGAAGGVEHPADDIAILGDPGHLKPH
jgi:hypothetical protein